ncbi:MAG TPA: hypothetical protein VNF93_02275 [Buchnera sp. (in: enterobacteria)]|nr:hypothetical protein [Buchnera sp. (in: enterobacteria)]
MTVTSFNLYPIVTPVRLSSPNNLSGTYFNGELNNGISSTLTSVTNGLLSVDGVIAQVGDRIFLFNQTHANENGIYDVVNTGSSITKWKIQRSNDFQSIEQLKVGQSFSVSAGNTLAGNMFVLVEPLPREIGLDNIKIFNVTGTSSGGPFLTVANNLSDVANVNQSYINLGLGEPFFTISDSDFSGGFYTITNPPPTNISLVVDNPGNTIILPNNFGEIGSLTPGQSIYFQSIGTATVHLKNSDGSQTFTDIENNQYYRLLLISDLGPGFWISQPYVLSINGMNGFVNIPIVVESWDGSTNPVDVTAGDGIDITNGVISLTGTGPSVGYGYVVDSGIVSPISFALLDFYLIPFANNVPLVNNVNNIQFYTTNPFGIGQVGIKNVGTEAGTYQIDMTCVFYYDATNTNPSSTDYYLSANLNLTGDGRGGFLPINPIVSGMGYHSGSDIPFTVFPGEKTPPVILSFQVTLSPNDIVFPVVRSASSTSAANNQIDLSVIAFSVNKVGDVGGTSAGVASLNGLTGALNITSPNSTLNIGTSGSNITADFNTSNFSSTNGILYYNGTNIVNSNALTWSGSVFTASTSGPSIQYILSTSSSGISNFSVYRSSRGDQTNGLAAYQWDTAGIAKWISAMFPGTAALTSNADDLIFRSFSGSQVVMALGQTSYDVTVPGGNIIITGTSKTARISSLTASQAVVTDSSKNLISLAYTDANTASTIVSRDSSGNFSAGTITASLSGNATTATSATTATTATTATNANNGATVSVSNNASYFPIFAASSTNGNQPFNLGTGLTFNPSTNLLTTTALTLSGLTSGSVIFSGVSGAISQDNTHLFYDSSGVHLYVGANSSSQTFQTPGVLNLYGTDGTTNNSLKFYTTADGYPGLSLFHDAHGNQAINFDSFWNGSNNISSYSGSNFQIVHLSNQLQFNYSAGIAQGSAVSYSTGLFMTSIGDVAANGNLIINTVNKGLQIKSAPVSAGTANAAFVTSVVLSTGTATVNDSFVTTSCSGTVAVVTSGGTPGTGYRLNIASGSFTVTSSSALDTSTLTVALFKGI